jgi:hypothetical protein
LGFSQDGGIDDILFDQLEKATAEASNARREAFQETINRGKAEKDAINAIRRVNLLYPLYFFITIYYGDHFVYVDWKMNRFFL